MPLTNLQGKHVDKYRFFRNFLSHNRSALNAIADMEQMYYSGRPFSLTASMVRYQELSEAAMGALYALDSLSHGKFPSLPDIFGKIEAEISEEFNPHLSLMTTDVVLALEDVAPEMKNIVGAKTANLASIKNTLALPVPRGFAITAYAFEKFLEESGLSKPIREELSKIPSLDSLHAMRRISGTLRAMILEATVPQSVADEIMKSYEALEKKTAKDIKIALRSSAIGEDSEASFAGQYASVLNVAKEDILDAYKNVVASKYSNRAINYRFQYGLRDRETPMAVLAIEMVDALASGVVYTLSPLPGESRAVKISSVWGLGEYLVSGTASPDTFLVERAGALITERTISRKEHEILSMESGGTGLVGVAEGKRDLPSIDDGAVFKLRDYGLMLEEFFGAPQDIEWAIDRKGNLYILQSRPLNLPKISDDDRIVKKDYPGNPVLISNGKTASLGIASGRIFIARQKGDLDGIPEHAILVAKTASPDYARALGRIAGIITEVGSITSHLSSIAREFGVPAIVDAKNATSLLSDGELVTIAAETGTVYRGIVEELIKNSRPAKRLIFESPVHKKMRAVLDKISPLNLTDPEHPSFSPEGCRTVHDIIRFTHEQAMRAMFGLTEETDEVRSARLTATIPLIFHLIDLGGGLAEGLTTCHTVTPQHIQSVPMKALWRGLTHPGINWAGTISLDMKNILTLFASSSTSEFVEAPGGISYAILSKEYMNLSAKFGYHFATVDTLCSENSDQNYISLQFAGGVGNYYGKTLRISFLGTVLRRLGFQVSLRGDLLDASLLRYDRAFIEDRLDQLGRLFASSRLLDIAISSQADVEMFTETFFREDYDFLSRKGKGRLNNFYTHGGYWEPAIEDGRRYCVQDGSRAGYGISSGVAGIMGRLVGPSLQDFLDNIEAYYYFPLAIAKNSDIPEGKISVKVKPVSGNIDRAGGIAFGIQNTGNYFVMRLNALENNVILFEYVNDKRIQRVNIERQIDSNRWYKLAVEIRGSSIQGYLDDALIMEHVAGRPLKGFVGLWTKADSVTYFNELTIQTDGHERVVEFQ